MSEQKPVRTGGNLIVNEIKVGDIHYEFEYGAGIKCKVLTKPKRNSRGYWTWVAENLKTGKKIQYGVTEGFAHYAPNLYDYEAYKGVEYI